MGFRMRFPRPCSWVIANLRDGHINDGRGVEGKKTSGTEKIKEQRGRRAAQVIHRDVEEIRNEDRASAGEEMMATC